MVVRGKVIDIISVTDNVAQIIIAYKKDEQFNRIAFTMFRDIIVLSRQLGLEKGDVVKIEYYLKSKKYLDKYMTSAIIEKLIITQKRPLQLMVDLETGEIL